MCEDEDCEAYLMTGDRDALQLISDHVHVLLATNNDTVDMDEQAFFEKYGVASSQFVDVKAMMGDSSDNIPGIPGIGEKTALKLIAEYGSLDGVYEALPTAKHTPSTRAKLENGKESAYLSQKLARICCQAPIGVTLADLQNAGIRREAARDLFLRLEFSAFIKRFDLTSLPSDGEPATAQAQATSVVEISVSALKDALGATAPVALDVQDGTWMIANESTVWRLTDRPADLPALLGERTVVCFDCKSLYKGEGGEIFRGLHLFDLMLGAYLVNSARSGYELSSLVSDYLGELYDTATPRIRYFLRLYGTITEKLEQRGHAALFTDIEMPLSGVLADM